MPISEREYRDTHERLFRHLAGRLGSEDMKPGEIKELREMLDATGINFIAPVEQVRQPRSTRLEDRDPFPAPPVNRAVV